MTEHNEQDDYLFYRTGYETVELHDQERVTGTKFKVPSFESQIQ